MAHQGPHSVSRLAVAVAVVMAALAALVACNESPQVAGIDGSGARIYAQGPITAFGSIVVNGVHYDVNTAVIRVNGEVATQSELAIGQVVTVQASVNASGGSVAESVDFESVLRGAVQSVDTANGLVFVLEHAVSVDASTTLDLGPGGSTIDSLNVGDLIEVSGLVGAEGTIEATHIARVASGSQLRIIGRVTNVDIGALTFSIGELVVDYSSAGQIEGFPTGGPRNGDAVLAIGQTVSPAGVLLATRLEFADEDAAEREGQEAEVEGLITRFVSPNDFDVSGKPSTTTAQTRYEGGTAGDLALNVKIEIEGRIDAEGVIVAEKIEVKNGGDEDSSDSEDSE